MNGNTKSGAGRRKAVAIAVGLLAGANACGGDDAAQDGVSETTTLAAESTAEASAGDDAAAETDPAEAQPAEGATFETVFGIPPFGTAAVTPGLEFTRQEDEFGFGERVDFDLTGADVRQVADFYLEALTAEGYEVSEVDLGGGQGFAVSGELPGDGSSRTIATIQIAPRPSGSETLGVTQTLDQYNN